MIVRNDSGGWNAYIGYPFDSGEFQFVGSFQTRAIAESALNGRCWVCHSQGCNVVHGSHVMRMAALLDADEERIAVA